ncbi:putative transcription factor ARF family [Dioscorea sansibarensis]
MKLSAEIQNNAVVRRVINSELWHACAGPLVSLPQPGSLVCYFPQGHSEQVTVSTRKTVNSQIPNYPSLSSQLMCRVHNVTLHACSDTDEVYAQISLQPVNSEMDMFSIPETGHTRSKQPSEFLCKNLTASDTSTHGGFSMPRRAAEKLFPPLDYSMQPPNQELIVRDIHDNLWTFRHIYRGQPKRHLLTTGWSSFVSAKHLKAGDAVLFIRGEKSQLLLGVRRACRQLTTMPSSVLSADSMHIGVLAAAAHAAASCSPFTVYYNPRACPSEFIVPLDKYNKLAYTPISIGMRFGMMFETEESSKRRYMGTIVGISDYDPLRWPNSRWRNLQVEWDEHGYGERPNRVSLWEIETPESLFVVPAMAPNLKRQCLPGFIVPGLQVGSLNSKSLLQVPESRNAQVNPLFYSNDPMQLLQVLQQTHFSNQNRHLVSEQSMYANIFQSITGTGDISKSVSCASQPISSISSEVPHGVTATKSVTEKNEQNILPQNEKLLPSIVQQSDELSINKLSSEREFQAQSEGTDLENHKGGNSVQESLVTGMLANKCLEMEGDSSRLLFQQLEPIVSHSSMMETSESLDKEGYCFHYLNEENWFSNLSETTSSLSGDLSTIINPENFDSFDICLPAFMQEFFSPPGLNPLAEDDLMVRRTETNSSTENYAQSENLKNQNSLASTEKQGIGSCVSSSITGNCSGFNGSTLQCSPESLVGNWNSNQDLQSQVKSLLDIPESSRGTSSASDSCVNRCTRKSVSQQPLRTYTKVQKVGSVGRSIDVTQFRNYQELKSAIACMFGLEGQLDDPNGSEWKLVYVDYENDILLVGDDPWEEFINCVRCIKILSLLEVQQMSEEGTNLINASNVNQMNTNPYWEDGSNDLDFPSTMAP